MRIISGSLRGRRFTPPPNLPTRPTTDFAKEGLFNILANHFDFSRVSFLDLFCGTGSISYEFFSRGCTDIVCVDSFAGCTRFVKQTSIKLGIPTITVMTEDVESYIGSCSRQFDIIFAGPPYAWQKLRSLPALVFDKGLLAKGGWFILEHNPANTFTETTHFAHERKYGTTIFSIFT